MPMDKNLQSDGYYHGHSEIGNTYLSIRDS